MDIILINLLVVAASLILVDKLVTAMTIKRVEKNFPNKNKFSVEKNPLAQYFFINFGLGLGTVLYALLSFFTFGFSVWLLHFVFGVNVSFYILYLIYIVVIINNLRWFKKFGVKNGI